MNFKSNNINPPNFSNFIGVSLPSLMNNLGGFNTAPNESDKIKWENYFNQLAPVNGYVTGASARNFFLKSGLSTPVLANIWDMADLDKDGKLNQNEFFIAMHLINQNLKSSISNPQLLSLSTSNTTNFNKISEHTPGGTIISLKTTNNDSNWAIPPALKQKFELEFKGHDLQNAGFLTGLQARNILLQSQLPQTILAQIWALSDIDVDGKLTCEEFILASYLTHQLKCGLLSVLPQNLPNELIPPSFKNKMPPPSFSMSENKNSVVTVLSPTKMLNSELGPDESSFKPVSFEDKRRENFDRGAAILEQKRAALLKAEADERANRERKEFAQQEQKRLQRLEQEKMKEIERQEATERQKESQIKLDMEKIKAMQIKEAARIELEKKAKEDMIEKRISELKYLEKQETNNYSLLVTREKDLDCDLQNMNEKILNMQLTLQETQTLAGKYRDTNREQVNAMGAIELRIAKQTHEIQDLDSKYAALLNEKMRLKDVLASYGFGSKENLLDDTDVLTPPLNFEQNNPEIAQKLLILQKSIKDLKEKVSTLSNKKLKLTKTLSGVEKTGADNSNNTQKLDDETITINKLQNEFNRKLELNDSPKHSYTMKNQLSIKTMENDKSDKNQGNNATNLIAYKATFDFKGRTPDELSFKAGDIIMVRENENSEDGWLGGKIGNVIGWFPATYAQKMDENNPKSTAAFNTTIELNKDNKPSCSKKALALFPLNSTNPGDLSFGKNDIINIQSELDDNWWIATLQNDPTKKGYVPKAYFKLLSGEEGIPAVIENQPKKSVFASFGKGDSIETDAFSTTNQSKNSKPNDHLFGFESSFSDEIPSNKNENINNFNIIDNNLLIKSQSINSTIENKVPTEKSMFKNLNTDSKNDVLSSEQRLIESTEPFISLYAFQAQEAGDLSFPPGAIILVDRKCLNPNANSDWWTGHVKQERGNDWLTGIFPRNYVKPATISSTHHQHIGDDNVKKMAQNQIGTPRKSSSGNNSLKHQTSIGSETKKVGGYLMKVIAIAPFTAGGPEQLSIWPGLIIGVRRQTPAGWWEGEILPQENDIEKESINKGAKKQTIGWFPGSHVKPLSSQDIVGDNGTTTMLQNAASLSSNSLALASPTSSTKQRHMADIARKPVVYTVKALYDYVSDHADDLAFKTGDLIHVTDKTSLDWWTGRNTRTNQSGLFPSNYVAPYEINSTP